LSAAVVSALQACRDKKPNDLLTSIENTKELVRASFERSMQNSVSEDEKNRGLYKFELYSTLRAINNYLEGNKSLIQAFQLAWGNELVSTYAPSANHKDYVSPFPFNEDEFYDFDYDKDLLLNALGQLTTTLDRLKQGGILGYYEISIPYDDYGGVVTIALDDYSSIGAEILLSEQKILSEGPVHSCVRALFDKAKISFSLDTFYIDPLTTRQENYNPSQLLLSLSGLSKA
jgi:hypothetical protein